MKTAYVWTQVEVLGLALCMGSCMVLRGYQGYYWVQQMYGKTGRSMSVFYCTCTKEPTY